MDRRTLLAALGAAGFTATLPRFALAAAPTDKRMVVVILRGAMDGLSAAPAFGDPDFERARNGIGLPRPGEDGGALDLDGFFGLNPDLKGLHGRWVSRQLVVFHAIASPYRDRSHFDGQNLLENGSAKPYGLADGWVNRALVGLPEGLRTSRKDLGVALAPAMPLILRGPAPVTSWSPSILPAPDADLIQRVQMLYGETDPVLSRALTAAVGAQGAATGMGGGTGDGLVTLMAAAARFMKEPGGPAVAVVESGGWDTHAGQAGALGPLQRNLRSLDSAVTALADGMGERWTDTAVLIVTEFGRTVARNGTGGTDHGTGGAAFLVGGAVAGGRVIADWPGLKPADLYAGRDLAPTRDLRSVMKAVLRDHMGVEDAHLEREVFPGSGTAKVVEGLFRT
jgi:uncharacterized protein (DUF1501 family)